MFLFLKLELPPQPFNLLSSSSPPSLVLAIMKLSVVATSLLAALADARCGQPVKRDIVPVTSWGGNPSGLNLHAYVPARLAAKPAVILAVRTIPSDQLLS